jgi:hypothetical protein
MWATGRLYWSDQVGAIVGKYYFDCQLPTSNAQLPMPKLISVRLGHFGAVDEESFNGAAFRLELEPKVLAQSGQE